MKKRILKHIEKVQFLIKKRSRFERLATKKKTMVAASFIARRFTPRAPKVYYLSASIDGKSRHRYVRKKEAAYWRKRALEWRSFSEAMSLWVKVNKQIEKEFREIGKLRCEKLPGGKGKRKQKKQMKGDRK